MSSDDFKPSTPSTSDRQRDETIQKRQRRTKEQMAADARREADKTRPRQSGKDQSRPQRFDARGRSVDLDKISALTRGETIPADDDDEDGGRSGADEARAKKRADEAPDGKPKPGAETLEKDMRDLFGEFDESQDSAHAKKGKGRLLADFAAEHELDVKELYGLLVPGDESDEPLTIGQLKDMRREVHTLETEKVEFEESQERAWAEVYQARTDVDGVLNELAQFASPEQLNNAFEEARRRHQTRLELGHKTLIERFPQWKDAGVMKADRERISAFAHKELGISPREFGQIFDPRVIIGLNRLERLTGWFQKVHQGKPETKSNSTPPSGRRQPATNRQQDAKAIASKGDTVGAIARLIG